MLQRSPGAGRSEGSSPWWAWFLESPVGRRVTYATVTLAGALCVVMILTHKATMSTVPPKPWDLR